MPKFLEIYLAQNLLKTRSPTNIKMFVTCLKLACDLSLTCSRPDIYFLITFLNLT